MPNLQLEREMHSSQVIAYRGEPQMRKPSPEIPELTDEQLATEMIELTCDDMESLTRAFEMISDLCKTLEREVAESLPEDIPENLIN